MRKMHRFRKGDDFEVKGKRFVVHGIWYLGAEQVAYDIKSNGKKYYVTREYLQEKGVL